jgi:hypothetical protein
MLLCEIIKEKSGSERKKATLRLLAEADKVLNMVFTFNVLNKVG